MASVQVTDNPEASRYEAEVDGRTAGLAEYRRAGDVVILPHTEVSGDFEGQGVGSALARHALEDVRSRGLRVLPACSFIAGYIERHPEYRDLVAVDV